MTWVPGDGWTLDVNNARVAVRNLRLLTLSGAVLHLDSASLDTGSGFDLIGPPHLLDQLVAPDEGQWIHVTTIDGRKAPARMFEATLEFPGDPMGALAISAVSLAGADAVLLGLPVLRKFHICLAPDPIGRSLLRRPS